MDDNGRRFVEFCNIHRALRNGLERVGYVRSHVASRVGELQPLKFNVNGLHALVVAQQRQNSLTDRTENTLSKPPENFDEHWTVIKSLFSQVLHRSSAMS